MEKERKVYETSFLFLPTLSEEEALTQAEGIQDEIAKIGIIINHESPVSVPLAYTMVWISGASHQRFDKGYFGWIKFEMSANSLASLKKYLDKNNNILRYLVVKTVRENTLLHGHMTLRNEEKARKEPELSLEEPKEEPAIPDLDKSIDDLVIV